MQSKVYIQGKLKIVINSYILPFLILIVNVVISTVVTRITVVFFIRLYCLDIIFRNVSVVI